MKLKFKLIAVLVLLSALSCLGAIKINKGIDLYAETTVKNSVYTEVSNAIYTYVRANGELFAQAVTRSFDKNGELVCVNINAAAMNSIQTGLEKEILATLESIESTSFYLSLGSLSGIKLLSDTGPKIKMKIVPLGTLSCDTINSFDSVGINHTLHKVGLNFTVKFNAAAPFKSTAFETKFTLLICESVIIGKVPEVFFN